MMEQQLKLLTEIAKKTDQTNYVHQLKQLEKMLQNGQFLLAVMGEFSAGKSRLINNLLGKQILPVHITETTAVVTYLHYAESEYAELVYQDQSIKQCSIDESKQLWQNKENEAILSRLSCIRIYVNSELLRNGLVIADTPGVNTVLKQHIEQTTRLIESSSRVLYVLGKTPTHSDIEFIETICKCNIPVMFVRTHWDLLNPDEENPAQSAQREKELLTSYTSDPIFFVSNDEQNEWFQKISSGVIPYISQKIASDAKSELSSAVQSRARMIAEKLQESLTQREATLRKFQNADTAAFVKEKKRMEEQIQKLQQLFDQKKDKLRQRFESVKSDANRSLPALAEQCTEAVIKQLYHIDFCKSDSESYVNSIMPAEIEKGCLKIRQQYLAHYNAFLTGSIQELQDEIRDMDGISIQNLRIPVSILEADAESKDIDAEIEALLSLEESLEEEIAEHQNRMQQAADKKIAAEENIEGLQDGINAIRSELEQYGSYVPRYKVRRGTHNVERGMGAVGLAADLATLLIPGPTWAVWGGRIVEKFGVKLAEGIQAAKEIDGVADVVRGFHVLRQQAVEKQKNEEIDQTVNGVFEGDEGYRELQEQLADKPPQLLDYLSLSYYFKKIGRKFDMPDTVVVDDAHQRQYQEGRDRIIRAMEEKARQAADEKIAVLRITEEEEKEQLLAAEKKKRIQAAEKEIKALQDKKDKEHQEAVNRKCREYYADTVRQCFTDYCNMLQTETAPVVEEKFQTYLETADVRILSDLQKHSDELRELEEKHNTTGADSYGEELEICNSYLSQLREILA